MRTIAVVVAFLLLVAASTAGAEAIGSRDIPVADGDTIFANRKTYRLVGFDAPETDRAKCDAERILGQKAAERLRALISQGGLDLTEVRCSCVPGTHGTRLCNYGRSCGILKAKGVDVGQTLIREGLARPYVCGTYRCPRRQGRCP